MYLNEKDYPFESRAGVDEAISQFSETLSALLKDEVKEQAEQYQSLSEKLNLLREEISNKERNLKSAQEKLEALETKFEQSDLHEMPQRYVDRFVEKYTKGICPGDKVWTVKRKISTKTCPCCRGAKKVKAKIDNRDMKVKCPGCEGLGSISNVSHYANERTVEQVFLKLCFEEYRVSVWTIDTISLRGSDYSENVSEIFKTKEECERYISEKYPPKEATHD